MDTVSTVFVTISTVCVLFGIGILFALCYQVHRYPDIIERPSMIVFSVLCIIFYIATLSVIMAMQISVSQHSNEEVGEWLNTHPVAFFSEELCWGIAQSITYLLFILRTYYAFHNTRYQSRQYVYCFMYCAIVLFMLCIVWRLVIFQLFRFGFLSSETATDQHAIEVSVKTITDLVLSIFMIRLFCGKLFEVALEVNPTDWHGLIGIAAKISILSIFALISTQISCFCSTFNLILFMMKGDTYLEKFIYYKIVMTWLTCLDCIITVICVYMAMPYPGSEMCYHRTCRGCHSLCLVMAKKRIKRKLTMQSHYRPLTEL